MRTIETTIDVDATPEELWETLVAFEDYPEWNPFVTAIEGVPAVGERLSVTVDPPRGRGMTFRPRVTAAEPGERLEWLGRLVVPGLFDGRHEFRIEGLGGGRSRLLHRESFTGLLVGLLLDESDVRAGFEAANAAFKTRVEERVAAAGDAPNGPVTA
ncbi:SRPBCC domain-containing protein [Haloarcula litorea]|uniref:SRPBCC domain-containing protein n=1 Tax=Haloarcula litorea TaxID=3032579 RepID=UPI0023E86CFA|nr:SRPBCC domain-containing protein [Halomicroarcula sp. GDY20]